MDQIQWTEKKTEEEKYSSFDATENRLAAIQRCLQNQYGCYYWLCNKINGQVIRWKKKKETEEKKSLRSKTLQEENEFWQNKRKHNVDLLWQSIDSYRDLYPTKRKHFYIFHISTITVNLISCFVGCVRVCVYDFVDNALETTVQLSLSKRKVTFLRFPGNDVADESFKLYTWIHFCEVCAKFGKKVNIKCENQIQRHSNFFLLEKICIENHNHKPLVERDWGMCVFWMSFDSIIWNVAMWKSSALYQNLGFLV